MSFGNSCLTKFYNGYAGAAKLDMLVAVGTYSRNGIEVLAEILPEGTGACAVEYSHRFCAETDRVVDVVSDGLDCFIDSHAPHVNLLLEIELAVALCI